MESHKTTTTTFMRPLDEILELLETTRPDTTDVVRLRVSPDRRVRNEPPPGGHERRKSK